MKIEDPKIDKLTRNLLQGTAKQPSASLMDRIMSAVIKEKQQAQKGYLRKLPSIGGLAAGFFVYLLIAAGLLYFFFTNPGEGSQLFSKEVIQTFPIFLTFAAGISFYFLFSQLDKWLFRKEKEKAKK